MHQQKKNEENYCGFFASQNPGRFSIRAQYIPAS